MRVGAKPADVNAVSSRLVRRQNEKDLAVRWCEVWGGNLRKEKVQRAGVAIKASKRGDIGRG